MAEEVGFEPTEGVNPRRFSRPVHSTTLPLLRRDMTNRSGMILKESRRGFFADLFAATFLDSLGTLQCAQTGVTGIHNSR